VIEANAPRQGQALPRSAGDRPRLRPAARPWAEPSWLGIGIVAVAMLILPWALTLVDGGNYVTHLIITFFVWGIVAQCWNLIMGVSGVYSFGQLALFQVGAFTTGVLSFSVGVSPWVSIWAAPIAAVAAALIIGLPTLRLRGIYVVLLTLAFHELLRNWITTGPQWISGGGYGLARVPRLGFDRLLGPQYERVFYYYTGLVFFGVATYAIWRVLNSPIGLAFRALRDSEDYAISRGVDPFRFKLFLFAFSAFFTGLAGGFSAHYNGLASTSLFDFGVMINLLVMIVLGGWGTFAGPIFGTAILTFLTELLRAFDLYRILALGVAMAVIAVAAPEGLVPVLTRAFHSLFGVLFEADEPPAT
jgi:branched-chain amino acid transport system permease protein